MHLTIGAIKSSILQVGFKMHDDLKISLATQIVTLKRYGHCNKIFHNTQNQTGNIIYNDAREQQSCISRNGFNKIISKTISVGELDISMGFIDTRVASQGGYNKIQTSFLRALS